MCENHAEERSEGQALHDRRDGGNASSELPLERGTHLLTIAVEDYFQATALNSLIPPAQWRRFESRVEENTDRALALLAEHGIQATFFVLGWIAEQRPALVKKIARCGHELATKGYYHRALPQLSREEFHDDLVRSRAAIEEASGRRVVGHRIARGHFGLKDLWALDVLADEGFSYDSSIYPRARSIAREPWRRFPHIHRSGDRTITEMPLSSWGPDTFLLPAAGGNYFRQLPAPLMRYAFAHWHRKYDAPFNMYFHVWELDPDLPRISSVGWLTRIRQYRNLTRMPELVRYYLEKYRFKGIADYLGLDIDAVEPRDVAEREIVQVNSRIAANTGDVVTVGDAATRDAAHEPAAETSGEETSGEESSRGARLDDRRADVTIVVPCYNEELILPYLSNTLEEVEEELRKRYRLSYVFVDDGSRDDTWRELGEMFGDRPNCKLVKHEKNRGVAATILTGIRSAETEIVCSIDCDCTYDPRQLGSLIPLLDDDVAMVTASPYHPLGSARNVPGWRLFLSKGLSRLYRLVLHHRFATYTSCFRVYRRSAVAGVEVRHGGFLGVVGLLGELDLRGDKIRECPAVLEVRMLGHSKMKTLSTIFGHLRLLASFSIERMRRSFGSATRSSEESPEVGSSGVVSPAEPPAPPEAPAAGRQSEPCCGSTPRSD